MQSLDAYSRILEISDTLNMLENSTKKDQPYTDNCIPVQTMPAIFLGFFPEIVSFYQKIHQSIHVFKHILKIVSNAL